MCTHSFSAQVPDCPDCRAVNLVAAIPPRDDWPDELTLQLRDTTMAPDTRRRVQLTLTANGGHDSAIELLLGEESR